MKDINELNKLRKSWEQNSQPLSVIADDYTVLVILKTKVADKYHCHRYFTIGGKWSVSVDGQYVPLEAVWSWLNKPSALSTQFGEYITPQPVGESPAEVSKV